MLGLKISSMCSAQVTSYLIVLLIKQTSLGLLTKSQRPVKSTEITGCSGLREAQTMNHGSDKPSLLSHVWSRASIQPPNFRRNVGKRETSEGVPLRKHLGVCINSS